MKLISGFWEAEEQPFILSNNETHAYPLKMASDDIKTMLDVIQNMTYQELAEFICTCENTDVGVPLPEIRECAPIPFPGSDVICLGENYMDHATESYRFQKISYDGTQPKAVYFSKRVFRTTGNREVVNGHFDVVQQMDYECELAVIIGKDAYKVKKENVEEYIFGYSIANDYSARCLQYGHKQNFFGKSLDTYFAMGPRIITADEIQFPPHLRIRCWVNDDLRQDSYTDEVFFTIDHIVSELSSVMTLKAGTIIITGTPKGVGMGRIPPEFLKHGDVVRCYIENIGELLNFID